MTNIPNICTIALLSTLIVLPAWAADSSTIDTIESYTVAADSYTEAEEATINQATIAKGKSIFETICFRCHKTNYDTSIIGAPGLQGIMERHDETWLNKWIEDPESFSKTDIDARDLVDANEFGLTMPTLPAMQDKDNRKAIIEYLKTLK